jgi:hypothetical protein
VAVNLDNLFDRRRLQQRGCDAFLNAEDDAFRSRYADSGRAELDCLEGIFDLKETAFRGEGAAEVTVLACCQRSGRKHDKKISKALKVGDVLDLSI